MEKSIEEFINSLDYENNYYFYHETGDNKAEKICEEGLLLSGYNILGVENLLYTTSSQLDEKIATNKELLTSFISSELSISKPRPVNEMIIIEIPKDELEYAVKPYSYNSWSNEDETANYIVDPNYIAGYFDLEKKEFFANPQSYGFNYKL